MSVTTLGSAAAALSDSAFPNEQPANANPAINKISKEAILKTE
jgi:hypothetical protein